jgi:hypothetical protein
MCQSRNQPVLLCVQRLNNASTWWSLCWQTVWCLIAKVFVVEVRLTNDTSKTRPWPSQILFGQYIYIDVTVDGPPTARKHHGGSTISCYMITEYFDYNNEEMAGPEALLQEYAAKLNAQQQQTQQTQ